MDRDSQPKIELLDWSNYQADCIAPPPNNGSSALKVMDNEDLVQSTSPTHDCLDGLKTEPSTPTGFQLHTGWCDGDEGSSALNVMDNEDLVQSTSPTHDCLDGLKTEPSTPTGFQLHTGWCDGDEALKEMEPCQTLEANTMIPCASTSDDQPVEKKHIVQELLIYQRLLKEHEDLCWELIRLESSLVKKEQMKNDLEDVKKLVVAFIRYVMIHSANQDKLVELLADVKERIKMTEQQSPER